MPEADVSAQSVSDLPAGTWTVDAGDSALGFRARGMFGLVPVTGAFHAFEGTLTVADGRAQGELRITAASLDTGNTKRDNHLRSADFFDVEHHPTVSFTLSEVVAAGPAAQLRGRLTVRDTTLEISAPATIETVDEDRLRLATALDVDRAAAGLGWSKMGMIKGPAHLTASILLRRQ